MLPKAGCDRPLILPKEAGSMVDEKPVPLYYRCPKGSRPIMDLETCQARKNRNHYGCVTCKVPAQKRREAKNKTSLRKPQTKKED